MSQKYRDTQTFWQKTKRFSEPLMMRKFIYGRFFIQSLLVPLTTIISIFFLEYFTEILLYWDAQKISLSLFYFFVFIFFAEGLIYATKNWWWMVTLYKSMDDLYSLYFKKYIQLDNNKIEQVWSGKLVGIIYEWVFRWSEILADGVMNIASLIVWIIFTIYMLSRIDTSFPFIFLWLILLFALITFFMNRQLQFFRSERYEYKNLVLKDFVKIIMSKNEILQTWKLNTHLKDLSYYLSEWSRISMAMSPYRTINKRAAPFLLHIALFTLFLYIFLYGNIWDLEVSFLVGLSWTFILMQKTILEFVKFYVDLNKQMVSVEKLWDFFDSTPQITGYEEWNTFEYKSWDIELQNISYSYSENTPVFQNFNLKICGGKVTALVWPSGGGKSTLVKLIAGYIRPDSWEVRIDTQKLSETSLKSYYQAVGYLTQEPSVFDGTVRENLMYGYTSSQPSPLEEKERATDNLESLPPWGEGIETVAHSLLCEGRVGERYCVEEDALRNIIKLAHCEFIYDLPNGLDTEIGERGVKLSWGQKQRLAIAKIFLKDPSIIILDEPTSALDSLSEKKITEAMHNLFKNRTVLVIAHRLQTVKHADDIIVIDSGNIIERGTHKELISRNWYYAEMLELQSGF